MPRLTRTRLVLAESENTRPVGEAAGKEDNPFLPAENLRGIFNLAGIVLPPVLLHGRVVGKWKQEKDSVRITLFEKVLKKDQKLMEREGKRWWSKVIIDA